MTITTETRINVEGTYNLRDAAASSDPESIGRGVLYRSDALGRLTDAGRTTLLALGITQVLDLRDIAEIDEDPDALSGTGIRLSAVPLYGGAAPGLQLDAAAGEPVAVGELLRRILRTQPVSLVAALEVFAKSEGPMLVHCTAGKDRTGVVVALALAIAGATDQAIIEDFSVSGKNLVGEWTEALMERKGITGPEQQDRFHAFAASSEPQAMREALDWLEARGGAARYLEKYGLRGATVTQIRHRLTPTGPTYISRTTRTAI